MMCGSDGELCGRTEAVAFLKEKGYHAFERNWAMGETIGVASDLSVVAGIEVWKKLIYLAPSPTGWSLHNLLARLPPVEVNSLREACLLAMQLLEDEELHYD